jgi:hypothetical protein
MSTYKYLKPVNFLLLNGKGGLKLQVTLRLLKADYIVGDQGRPNIIPGSLKAGRGGRRRDWRALCGWP